MKQKINKKQRIWNVIHGSTATLIVFDKRATDKQQQYSSIMSLCHRVKLI